MARDFVDAPRTLAFGEKVQHAAFAVAVCDYQPQPNCTVGPLIAIGRRSTLSTVALMERFLPPAFVPIPTAPRLVSVGRLSHEKGQALLIKAVARLRDQGVVCQLVLIGDGPLRGEIERLVHRGWILGSKSGSRAG